MQITTFPRKASKKGTVLEFNDWAHAFEERFSEHKVARIKDGELYSLAHFPNNSRDREKRAKQNIKTIDGVVLDFDNSLKLETGEKVCIANPTTYDDIYRELGDIYHIWHTTHSNTENWPKFRVIIPFAEPVPNKNWLSAYKEVVEMLGGPVGIDPDSSQITRAYFFPYCYEDHKHVASSDQAGSTLFSPELTEMSPEEERAFLYSGNNNGHGAKKDEGRRNMFVAQASEGYRKGKNPTLIANEILGFDNANYTPPYHTIKTEGIYKTGNALLDIQAFVTDIGITKELRGDEGGFDLSGFAEPPVLNRKQRRKLEKKAKKEKFAVPQELLDTIPGVTKDIQQYILKSSIRPQPSLALGAALCVMGALKWRRTFEGLRTNLYILGLGKTSGGKSTLSKGMQEVLKAANCLNYYLHTASSDSALQASLKREEHDGHGLMEFEEIGAYFENIVKSPNSSGNERKLMRELTILFSKANQIHFGRGYSERDPVTIPYPHVSVWGSTVPDSFYESMSSSQISNGFLPRFLVVGADNPRQRRRRVSIEDRQVSEDLRYKLQRIDYVGSAAFPDIKKPIALPTEGADEAEVPKVNRKKETTAQVLERADDIEFVEIPLTPRAEIVLQEIDDFCHEKEMEFLDKGVQSSSDMWGKAGEHIRKIALAISDGDYIGHEELGWAARFVEHCLNVACSECEERISNNDEERLLKLFRKKLRDVTDEMGRAPTKSEFTRKVQHICKRQQRVQVLISLEESGEIRWTPGSPSYLCFSDEYPEKREVS